MSRILRHVGHKDFQKTHQRKIDEYKKLAAKKLKEWQEAEEERKQIEEAARPFKSNWRNEVVILEKKEVVELQEPKVKKILEVNREKCGIVSNRFVEKIISEGMTSSGVFQTTLPAQGDVDLVSTTTNVVDANFTTNLNWSTSNGVAISADDPSRIIPGATSTVWRRADMKIPIPADQNISTVKITVSKGGGTLNWTDREDPVENWDADLSLSVSGGTYQSVSNAQSGVYTFDVDPNGSPYAPGFVFVNFSQFAKINATGQTTVQVSFQRRTPVNVFVSLDSPEATAFIRTDPIMRGLSAAERYKKLEDLLNAGDEYILKALGMQSSPTRPADTGNVKSWQQAADEVDYGEDLTPLSDNPYGTELAQIASVGDLGMLGMGIEGLAAAASLGVAGLMAAYNMSKEMATWLVNKYSPDAGKAVRDAQDYERGTSEQQKQETAEADQKLKDATAELEAANASGDPERIARAEERRTNAVKNRQRVRNKWKTNRQNQKNSYEPTGEILTEKKRLKSPKDLQNKIPGYYDGKPSPLGFPMEPPPKLVNGMHPDLVDGKKVADRFNKLDPQSAKAMPPTGNPHIDKKVRAAVKKIKTRRKNEFE